MATSWVTMVNMAAGHYVIEDDMDDLRGNLEKLGAMRWGPDPISDIDDGKILGGIGFGAYGTGTQVIPALSLTLVTWITDFDTNGAFASNRFTVPAGAGGLYQINCRILTNSGLTYYEVQNKGVNVMRFGSAAAGGAMSGLRQLAVGDYLELFIYSTGGCTIDKSNRASEFSAVKVG